MLDIEHVWFCRNSEMRKSVFPTDERINAFITLSAHWGCTCRFISPEPCRRKQLAWFIQIKNDKVRLDGERVRAAKTLQQPDTFTYYGLVTENSHST